MIPSSMYQHCVDAPNWREWEGASISFCIHPMTGSHTYLLELNNDIQRQQTSTSRADGQDQEHRSVNASATNARLSISMHRIFILSRPTHDSAVAAFNTSIFNVCLTHSFSYCGLKFRPFKKYGTLLSLCRRGVLNCGCPNTKCQNFIMFWHSVRACRSHRIGRGKGGIV